MGPLKVYVEAWLSFSPRAQRRFHTLIMLINEDGSSTTPIIATPNEEGGFKFEFSLHTKFQYCFGLTDNDGLNIVESRMRQVL